MKQKSLVNNFTILDREKIDGKRGKKPLVVSSTGWRIGEGKKSKIKCCRILSPCFKGHSHYLTDSSFYLLFYRRHGEGSRGAVGVFRHFFKNSIQTKMENTKIWRFVNKEMRTTVFPSKQIIVPFGAHNQNVYFLWLLGGRLNFRWTPQISVYFNFLGCGVVLKFRWTLRGNPLSLAPKTTTFTKKKRFPKQSLKSKVVFTPRGLEAGLLPV